MQGEAAPGEGLGKRRSPFPCKVDKGGVFMPDLELEQAVARAVNEGTVKLVLSAPRRCAA